MCTSMAQSMIQTAQGVRASGGQFTPDSQLGVGAKWRDRHPKAAAPSAEDVPLGSGLTNLAKTSILNRREQIRNAVEGS